MWFRKTVEKHGETIASALLVAFTLLMALLAALSFGGVMVWLWGQYAPAEAARQAYWHAWAEGVSHGVQH